MQGYICYLLRFMALIQMVTFIDCKNEARYYILNKLAFKVLFISFVFPVPTAADTIFASLISCTQTCQMPTATSAVEAKHGW